MKKIILSLIALSAIAVSSCQPTTAKAEAKKSLLQQISPTYFLSTFVCSIVKKHSPRNIP